MQQKRTVQGILQCIDALLLLLTDCLTPSTSFFKFMCVFAGILCTRAFHRLQPRRRDANCRPQHLVVIVVRSLNLARDVGKFATLSIPYNVRCFSLTISTVDPLPCDWERSRRPAHAPSCRDSTIYWFFSPKARSADGATDNVPHLARVKEKKLLLNSFYPSMWSLFRKEIESMM